MLLVVALVRPCTFGADSQRQRSLLCYNLLKPNMLLWRPKKLVILMIYIFASPNPLIALGESREGQKGAKFVPRTLDITAMQGFSGFRFGLWTRSVCRGGRRIGLWPAIFNEWCGGKKRLKVNGLGHCRRVVAARLRNSCDHVTNILMLVAVAQDQADSAV